MLHRTLRSAQDERSPSASWKSKCIVQVCVAGQVYWRTYVFDQTNACKRCRGSRRQLGRINCTGHTCDRCGNPFAAFTRQSRTKRSGEWKTMPGCYGDTGKAH